MFDKMKEFNNYKTVCCGSEFYKKGRADYRCKKCDKDVTLELVYVWEMLNE